MPQLCMVFQYDRQLYPWYVALGPTRLNYCGDEAYYMPAQWARYARLSDRIGIGECSKTPEI